MFKRFAIHIFFTVYLLLGLFLVPDYGIGWDEWIMRDNALRNLNWAKVFLNGGEQTREEVFFGNIDEHGPAFQFVLLAAEELFSPQTTASRILIRHNTTFVLFAFLSLGFYLLLRKVGFSVWLSLLGWMALVLYPRIFAHSIFNSKDPLLMVLFAWITYVLLLIFKTNQYKWHLAFGLLLGLVADIRVIALVFIAPYGFYWMNLFLKKRAYTNGLLGGGLVVVAFLGMSILAWPFLWEHPVTSFLEQFKVITEVKQPNPTLFFGTFYAPKAAPRWYLPGYFGITIPVIIWIPFFYGFYDRLRHLKQNQLQEIKNNPLFWIALLLFFLPLIASMVLTPVFYNGWRHFQFMYPFLLIVALYGLKSFLKWKKVNNITAHYKSIFAASFFIVLIAVNGMLHPFGGTYFNLWMGANLEGEFECDYWGINFNKAWEYLSENTSGRVKVYVSDRPGIYNLELLPIKEQERFEIVSTLAEAEYLVSNHNHFQDFSTQLWYTFYFGENRPALGKEVFKAGTYQLTAVSVFQLR
ncbi:MAG: hypothetical protein CL843_03205 [Crocinitomicaceae bacterium]|nr:hypothetical protein [Crocinitomicaceae bacterium]|tara:strand:- start:4394 stop:5965 length:1572 start_codon:yes stop_codon:yes gene_type:complete